MDHHATPSTTDPSPSAPWRVGDLVEVRPLAEIAATLDEKGDLEGMPFMPEMAAFCGRRFRVVKTAHKTCDVSGWRFTRALGGAVHLDTRCDGACHGDCEAACRVFWKTAWLKRIDDRTAEPAPRETAALTAEDDLVLSRLRSLTDHPEGAETVYRCQATEIKNVTTRLHPWDLGQYRDDVAGGNVDPATLVRVFADNVIRFLRSKMKKAGLAIRRRLRGGGVRKRSREFEPLDLVPGEVVRVKSLREIEATLNDEQKNFGLSFDADMVRLCGTTQTVMARIHRIIDENTGRMIRFRRGVVTLRDITCSGLCYPTRMFCPRGSLPFWREGWLERVAPSEAPAPENDRRS